MEKLSAYEGYLIGNCPSCDKPVFKAIEKIIECPYCHKNTYRLLWNNVRDCSECGYYQYYRPIDRLTIQEKSKGDN